MYRIDEGGIYLDPDYVQAQGQVQQIQAETERALLDLQNTPITNLTLSNTGNNVTLAFSAGALTASFNGTAPYTQITGLGTLATKNQGVAVADPPTLTAGGLPIGAAYSQSEMTALRDAVITLSDKVRELLGAIRGKAIA